MNYICNNCEKDFKQKSHYNNHINRKNPCKPVKKNIYVEDSKLRTTPHNSAQLHTEPNIKGNDINTTQILVDNDIDTLLEQNNNKYQCPHCFIILSRSDVLHRHIEKYCNVVKKENEEKKLLKEIIEEMKELKKEIKELKEENKELKTTNKVKKIKNTSNNNCNNTNTINSNNTIIHNHNTIVAFDKEDFDSVLDDAECTKLLTRGRTSVLELLKYIHFNEKYPQFHNCYISNMRDFRGIIYDGNNWLLKNNDEIIDKLIEKNDEYLVDKFDELKDKLTKKPKEQFKRYLGMKEDPEENQTNLLQYKGEIKEILYNKRKIVEETRKKDTERKKEMEKNKLLENQKVEQLT
jgi:hypothetical protein